MLLTALKGFTEDFIVLNIDNLLEWLLSPELAGKSNFVYTYLFFFQHHNIKLFVHFILYRSSKIQTLDELG